MIVKVLNIIDSKTFKAEKVTYKKHKKYKKYITFTKKYLVHFDGQNITIGDEVNILETRPISKKKRWKLKN